MGGGGLDYKFVAKLFRLFYFKLKNIFFAISFKDLMENLNCVRSKGHYTNYLLDLNIKLFLKALLLLESVSPSVLLRHWLWSDIGNRYD